MPRTPTTSLRSRRRARTTPLLLVPVLALALGGCGLLSGDDGTRGPRAAGGGPSPVASPDDPSESPSADPDTPSGWGPTEGEIARARDLVDGMSDADRVATVLMPGFWGYDGVAPTAAEAAQNQLMHGVDSPAEVAAGHPFGGFFLRPEVIGNADQVRRLAGVLHRNGDGPDGLPLLVSMDQEGGVVQRLKEGVDVVPSAQSIGQSGSAAYARKVALANGRTLRGLGVTMVLAPVADVDPDGTSVMGSRTYSPDRKVAARMVVATIRGYLAAGLVPAVKHFPGLGTVTGDSHHSLPVQPKPLDLLDRTDLVTFRAAVDAGAPVVMTGHVAVPSVEKGMPASLSEAVITRVLRDDLGFQGVAITDSQGMGPVFGKYGVAEGAIRSLLAGNDLVLNSPKPMRARRALLGAVRSGRISEERLTEAATRVEALRIYQQRLAAEAS
ncbi:MAG TPA: glycoside hydrolase family 3 N-terminal domain-containing protein [Actinomycetes bacterium]|nr:glycoside hydrolase family 3 N-terminal domain-containing protein [Actinomycetes bacterium]